jgi:Mg2+/Co2+ transporter CorC
LAVAKESIAGIMLAKSALNKVGNVAAFGLSNLSKQSDVVPEPQKIWKQYPILTIQITKTRLNNNFFIK